MNKKNQSRFQALLAVEKHSINLNLCQQVM